MAKVIESYEEEKKEKRKSELLNFLGEKNVVFLTHLVNDAVALECKLDGVMKLPFVKYKNDDPTTQVRTEASKEYHDLLNSYIAVMKTLSFIAGKTQEDKSESPLVAYLNSQKD